MAATPPIEAVPDDDDVISPESVWRFARSLCHPLFLPHRYFALSAAQPRRYLKATEALTLVFVALWLADQRVAESFKQAALDVSALKGTVEAAYQAFRAAWSTVLVWGVPFFVHFGARLTRTSVDWRGATRIGAYLAAISVWGTVLQLAFGMPGTLVSVALTFLLLSLAFRQVGRMSVLRALAATLITVVVEVLVIALVAAVMGGVVAALA